MRRLPRKAIFNSSRFSLPCWLSSHRRCQCLPGFGCPEAPGGRVAQRFAFGLELGDALIQWPIGRCHSNRREESQLSAPEAVG